MLHRLTWCLTLALLLHLPAVAPAQETPDSVAYTGADTLSAAGRRDGRAAADRADVERYVASGFVAGAATGFFGLLAGGASDGSSAGVLAVGGLAAITGAASQGGGSRVVLPPELESQVRERERPYWQAFRAEYAERVRARRRGAVLRGATVGFLAGVAGIFALYVLDGPST